MSIIDYNVIASGSSGNAVRIENIMFDCGVPFSRMKKDLYKVDYLLITHEHTDHLKKATLNAIVRQFPNIRIYSTYRVSRLNENVVAINLDYLPIDLGDKLMYAVDVPHNVLTYGYIIVGPEKTYIYATDLSNTESLSKFCTENGFTFDGVFLEANYDPEKLRAMGDEWHGQYNAYYDSSARHLSKDDSTLFYAKFKKKDGEYIELHKSRRFY